MGILQNISWELIAMIVGLIVLIGFGAYFFTQGKGTVKTTGSLNKGATETAQNFLNQIQTEGFAQQQATLIIARSDSSGTIKLGNSNYVENTITIQLGGISTYVTSGSMYFFGTTSTGGLAQITKIKTIEGNEFTIPTIYDPNTMVKVLYLLVNGKATPVSVTVTSPYYVVIGPPATSISASVVSGAITFSGLQPNVQYYILLYNNI